jgi:hypothetical protein
MSFRQLKEMAFSDDMLALPAWGFKALIRTKYGESVGIFPKFNQKSIFGA